MKKKVKRPRRFITFRGKDGGWYVRDRKNGRVWMYRTRGIAEAAASAAN